MHKKSFSRTTITVPCELKKRMKRAGSLLNWSAIACEAFETKLEEIGPFEEITSIDGAVRRLKASTESEPATEAVHSESGAAAGRHWALNLANAEQLSALEEFHCEAADENWSELLHSREGWLELTRRIATDEAIEAAMEEESEHGHGHRRHHRGGGRDHGRRGRGRGPGGRRSGGQHKRHHFRARAFWRSVLDERPSEPGFFCSFADAALDVWKQVKPQLDD
ncbi:hypothetical protein Q31b_41600 [Novipirellula aureliae]|uniref:Uncharacterized protein n=1 Tax=Novipirellula aureliae TaxID=2527966 RepID=A0A5C6DQP8_9BACT|nr:hypothetical protein [Novipirellula aureliae]TWU39078.1 hypothetical protein Q31b_41600 [Novipirellula aureliae]